MLKSKEISSRNNTCELRMKSIVSQLVHICTSFESFENSFYEDLNALPRVNCSHCSDWYKLQMHKDKVEVWHKNVLGDMDRLVIVITDDGIKKNDPFNF